MSIINYISSLEQGKRDGIISLLLFGFLIASIILLFIYKNHLELVQSDPCSYCINKFNFTCFKLRVFFRKLSRTVAILSKSFQTDVKSFCERIFSKMLFCSNSSVFFISLIMDFILLVIDLSFTLILELRLWIVRLVLSILAQI